MTELAAISLENEMDLILAYKKSIRTGELLGLTISTQTAFATAVSEVCREVIDKGLNGLATIGTIADSGRFLFTARISCSIDEDFRPTDGFEYARKLVPVLDMVKTANSLNVELRLAIPRSCKVDVRRVQQVKQQINDEGPISAYEEVKLKNARLHELNQQNETELVKAKYMDEQKNEFLSVVSHEINSPLTILRSFAQLALRADKGQNAVLAKYLTKIDMQTTKLANLIRQLLDISKLEHGDLTYNRELTPVHQFMNEQLEGIRLLVPAHPVTVELAEDCDILIDKLRMEQVINNMVGNAAKYSDPGSSIAIRTILQNGRVIFEIADSGIGMSQETIDNVFKKFYRSEQAIRKYSGLGMGLYIASRIINDHDGVMSVNSTEGKGSVFSFSLPLAG